MTDSGERFVVTVSDHAPSESSRPAVPAPAHNDTDAIPAGFGLAVISGLADDVRVLSTDSGVSVRMSWPSVAGVS
jgi:serine/threonine-protein kinase RsbW